jgi:hypothetical protein
MAKRSLRKLALFFCSLLFVFPAAAQTTDEIIAKYLTARGGLAKIKVIQSERVTGTISIGPGTDGPLLVERARPLKMHMEVTMDGRTYIRTYDGKSSGWVYNPFAGVPSVEPMTETELRNIFEEADFEGPFVDFKAKGNQIQFAGKEELKGKPAYRLKLTSKNGAASDFYFDASNFLLLKVTSSRKVDGKDVFSETFFSDYREVDGLKYPFLIESDTPGTEQTQKIVAEKIEVNVRIDEARFGKPSPPAPSPATADTPKPN